MRYWMTRDDVEAGQMTGDTVAVLPLFDDDRGCAKFAQRVLSFGPGRSAERETGVADEVLYALRGSGTIVVGDARLTISEGTGVFVGAGGTWSAESSDGLELVSVLVHEPESEGAGRHALVDLEAEGRRSATASRQFTLGVTPDSGCPSVTQFIGYIPPGRAPDHFHRYDEVIYILDGEGVLHIGGEEAPLAAGACVHLPARLVHSLANTGPGEMRLLGVFRPGGSPAEAYYPDGTPAVYPEES
ncbi:MAG TPA: cupin domain-containing protein [Gaiellaceae bacterium]